ncbi:MAG: hypothetical protein N3B10_15140, partial [Armatimonadetes bacterium]|nr:hypothetical protein [Armatimonadota bacterium]
MIRRVGLPLDRKILRGSEKPARNLQSDFIRYNRNFRLNQQLMTKSNERRIYSAKNFSEGWA